MGSFIATCFILAITFKILNKSWASKSFLIYIAIGLLVSYLFSSVNIPLIDPNEISIIALAFLMFFSGFSLSHSYTKSSVLESVKLACVGTVVPFVCCTVFTAVTGLIVVAPHGSNQIVHVIFVGIAAGVTSLPFISSIFFETKLINTTFAKVILAASSLQDIIFWPLLTVLIYFGSSQNSAISLSINSFFSLLLFLVIAVVGIKFQKKISNFVFHRYGIISEKTLFALPLVAIIIGEASSLGVALCSFTLGILVSHFKENYTIEARQKFSETTINLFIPLYFFTIGNILYAQWNFVFSNAIAFILTSSAATIISLTLIQKKPERYWAHSASYGIAMNTRGGPGIVMAYLAYSNSLISQTFFTTLLLASIITTIISWGWFSKYSKHGFIS
ncbi:cation:proton antiporter [Paracoccaceae bacterium]|nr:cation:proton antiporter [Paracoccaceae bacterium]